ncbi:hypothetical protein F0562_007381 [Nyssa sinensis]|uniref:Uncharacterized protein n=1 Tax=Nyssa sinensis TaxID=561372 RepID=A0A5J5A6G8_9ASTE|nr:hypothetical protein F0562_007381 [Nyssa sinensis]
MGEGGVANFFEMNRGNDFGHSIVCTKNPHLNSHSRVVAFILTVAWVMLALLGGNANKNAIKSELQNINYGALNPLHVGANKVTAITIFHSKGPCQLVFAELIGKWSRVVFSPTRTPHQSVGAIGLLMDRFDEAQKATSLQEELKRVKAELKTAQIEVKNTQTELTMAKSNLTHVETKLRVSDADLGAAQARVMSLETKCKAIESENIVLSQKLGVMIDQRDMFRQKMEEQKKKVKDTEVAAATKLEEVKIATQEATKAGMMDLVNSMGRELVDSGYLLCRKKIQKLYPNLDISCLDDVEVESLPSSPNPPDMEGFVETVPPLSSVPPKPK